MFNKVKETAVKTKDFVSRNRYELAYTAYIVGCVALGYYGTKKTIEALNTQVQKEVEHRTLFNAAAAGHEFKYDPSTDTLWDLTVRPDMK